MNSQLFLRTVVLLVGLASLSATPNVVHADWISAFRDDFDGPDLNLSAWIVEESNGSFDIQNGFLLLRSDPSGLPIIVSGPGMIPESGDVKIVIGFRYVSTTCFGTRIGLEARTERVPLCNNEIAAYGFHRDCARGTNAFAHPVNTSDQGPCGLDRHGVQIEAGTTSYHVGEMILTDAGMTVVVDGGTLASASAPLPRPDVVFFGKGAACCQYTEFDIDFVEVFVRDEPVQSQEDTWGRIKGERR